MRDKTLHLRKNLTIVNITKFLGPDMTIGNCNKVDKKKKPGMGLKE